MTRSGVLLAVALVALLIVQAVICTKRGLEDAMQWEEKGLEYDKLMFRDLRIEDFVHMSQCKNIRNRRRAYELARGLEEKREQAIRSVLNSPKEGLTLATFMAELRKINNAALEDVVPIREEMQEACSFPASAREFIDLAAQDLRDYLKLRMNGNQRKRSVANYWVHYEHEDTWDQSEVDLESDQDGVKAIAEAIRNEESALKDDDQQLKYMSQDYVNAGSTIKRWRRARRAAIKKVLSKEFTSAKQLRRELYKVHKRQLAELRKLNDQFEDELGEEDNRWFVYWADNLFFERMVAVIKGKVWSEHKESSDVSPDFEGLLYD